MGIKRKRLQGVLNILSFNRHFYIIGLIVLAILIVALTLIKVNILWISLILAVFLYGFLMPLIVSAYVYDFSGYYDFDWLLTLNLINSKPKHIVNINAGFDETSFIIESKFPQAKLKVFDFYDSKKHTEPAIVRARKVSLVYPNTLQIKTDRIPLRDNSVDLIFLLSAAHEIRSMEEKVTFLRECNRVCKSNGKVITVEHLRDVPNFFAFSIGFTHFFSRKTWKEAFEKAGFSRFEEIKFTSFMSIFKCTP